MPKRAKRMKVARLYPMGWKKYLPKHPGYRPRCSMRPYKYRHTSGSISKRMYFVCSRRPRGALSPHGYRPKWHRNIRRR